MATFTLTDLGNKSGEVVEAAFRGPVDITSRGRRKFVLLTADDFDRLRDSGSAARAPRGSPEPRGANGIPRWPRRDLRRRRRP